MLLIVAERGSAMMVTGVATSHFRVGEVIVSVLLRCSLISKSEAVL